MTETAHDRYKENGAGREYLGNHFCGCMVPDRWLRGCWQVRLDMGHDTVTPPQLIELDKAVLCEQCHRISESTGETCLGCGSKAISNVARLLAKESPMMAEITRMVDEALNTQ